MRERAGRDGNCGVVIGAVPQPGAVGDPGIAAIFPVGAWMFLVAAFLPIACGIICLKRTGV